MSLGKKREQLKKLFQHPYRIVVFNDLNLHIINQARFNARTLLMFLVSAVIFIIIAVTMLIAFTPLREYIPGYTSGNIRRTLINNVLLVDSLEHEIQLRDIYFNDFRLMIMGESPVDTTVKKITPDQSEEITLSKYNADSLFKDELRAEHSGTAMPSLPVPNSQGAGGNVFHSPVKGIITAKLDLSAGHYGIDFVGKLNSPILAPLDGTVILAEWTMQTGYVIQIQHGHNLVTVYKHNAELLKKQGDRVKAGETIAYMGNTGKETTGPHLHFEMWMNGICLDPEEYIKF